MRYSGFVFGRFRTSDGALSAKHSGPGAGTGSPPPGFKPFEPWIFRSIANQVEPETLYAKIGPSKHWVLTWLATPSCGVTSNENHSCFGKAFEIKHLGLGALNIDDNHSQLTGNKKAENLVLGFLKVRPYSIGLPPNPDPDRTGRRLD